MKLVTSILTLGILAIGRCRDLSYANREEASMSEETERILVCFEEPLGCFPETEPGIEQSFGDKFYDWRVNNYWRSSREKVATEFRWWAPGKKSATAITNFNFHVHFEEKDSGFESDIPTFFIIHGYQGDGEDWEVDMKNALMRNQRCNVIIVVWTGGSGRTYSTAVANTWVVGAETGRLIQRMEKRAGLKLENVHIIGHSLGAHAAGLTGKWIKYKMNKQVGRITGLDPAGPDYEDVVATERLDKGDAKFVDVIHTNLAEDLLDGLGIIKPIGHFDFYPNGGDFQGGCPTAGETGENFAQGTLGVWFKVQTFQVPDVNDVIKLQKSFEGPACSHHRAIDLFLESINSPCRFASDQCTSWEDFQAKKCPPGGLKGVPMGLKAAEFKKKALESNDHKKFYLRTSAGRPFCLA